MPIALTACANHGTQTRGGIRNPIRLSATPAEYRIAPPTLGQHTDEILGTLLGLTRREIASLREDRVI